MKFNYHGRNPFRGRTTALAWAGICLLAGIGLLFLPAAQGAAADMAGETGIWQMARWSPYAVGVLIGLLSWAAFLLSDKPLGVSTAYARTAGMLEEKIKGPEAADKPYYREYVPKIDWEWMLVLGLFTGAFGSAMLSGSFDIEAVPALWAETFDGSIVLRWAVALVGGFLLGLGARWADGCTSGHGISGTLQLVVSSWVALICFFLGGVLSTYLLYRLGS
ncbi:MAG: YeeE/YedE thiosulfate transporter family protein [Desulfosarcina sp.]